MKQPLTPSLQLSVSHVADIADRLSYCAATDFFNVPKEAYQWQNDLDWIASAVCLEDLKDAPAKLDAVARSFRKAFPARSLGHEDAAALNNIAVKISESLPPVYAAWPNLPPFRSI
jgi:hypothetical protein